MACCASVACVCASVDSEDTMLAVQTRSVKANWPWHQTGPPLMNHVPEVNSIETRALSGSQCFSGKKRTGADRKWDKDTREWIYDDMNYEWAHELYMSLLGREQCRIKSTNGSECSRSCPSFHFKGTIRDVNIKDSAVCYCCLTLLKVRFHDSRSKYSPLIG